MILFRTKWYLPLMSRTADMWLLFQTCWDASPCADTKEKAIANAKDVKRAWIEAALESNVEIHEPEVKV